MNETELLEALNKTVDQSIIRFDSITTINHKPHPYCIGPKHLKYNDSMYLGRNQIEKMEREHGPMCEMYTNNPNAKDSTKYNNKKSKDCQYKCNLNYEEHTSNKVIAIKCLKDISKEDNFSLNISELQEAISKLGIDGFVFVDNFTNKEE
jgi:hypothetical protein